MISEQIIIKHLAPYLESRNLFIVDIYVSTQNQIEIIIDGDNYVSVEDCADVSRYVESFLNRDIEDYALIVSSPDAHNPLKLSRQYPKHIGKDISVLTNDNKEYKGKMLSANEEEICVLFRKKERINGKNKTVEEEIRIPYNQIKKANILLPF